MASDGSSNIRMAAQIQAEKSLIESKATGILGLSIETEGGSEAIWVFSISRYR